jgi:signal transduction histidine kinase
MTDKGRILVVDDHQRNREICEENLEMEGYRILLAENGKEGLHIARLEGPDLILLDIMMPEMNGYEMLEELKSDEQLKDIPVLMLTAKASTADVVQALNLGANDYLKKPFDIDELVARADTLVRLKKAEDQLKQSISRMEHQAALGIQAAGAAHDLSNVLGVLSYHQIIEHALENILARQTEKQKDELTRDFQVIQKACHNLHEATELGITLCNAFTSFARADGQRVQSIVPFISAPLDMFRRRFRSKNIEVHTDLPQVQPIRCDSGQIQRIILNLLENAIYALEQNNKNERKLGILLRGEEDEVVLTVSDTGPGIPEEVLPRIFDYQFTTKGQKGSGIGLDTVRKIVESHSGRIDVQSEAGHGTTFTVAFPSAKIK